VGTASREHGDYCHRFLGGRKEVKEKWMKWKKKKTKSIQARGSQGNCFCGWSPSSPWSSHLAPPRRLVLHPNARRQGCWAAGRLWGWPFARRSARWGSLQLSRRGRRVNRLRCVHANATRCWNPEAGCWLWPSVLQNLGSAHADANRRLRSTRLSPLPLMLGPGWQILSAQGAVLVKPVFFCTETSSTCFHRRGFVCAPDCRESRSFVPG